MAKRRRSRARRLFARAKSYGRRASKSGIGAPVASFGTGVLRDQVVPRVAAWVPLGVPQEAVGAAIGWAASGRPGMLGAAGKAMMNGELYNLGRIVGMGALGGMSGASAGGGKLF